MFALRCPNSKRNLFKEYSTENEEMGVLFYFEFHLFPFKRALHRSCKGQVIHLKLVVILKFKCAIFVVYSFKTISVLSSL